ncbi:ArsR/SmtB family transcription factor [Salibacterium halotolerans]|uniref:DNA-binding transcriptional regulator, ArsR family n=1 Tax=Salibacterium halotolerans TaxID=1884432 RepID=A0A1I5L5M6_9BACI|nr:metalloregulator ArsR/SmtB family transcription factor [Salibacterium halotolerans]SFO92619.1 DNA-binding transcriptional regulator, ArsR family [Salibacterium halotolerans]
MKREEVCEVTCVDEEKVARLQASIDDGQMDRMAAMFKGLADKNRMTVLQALAAEGEICVCDASHLLGASTATTSHHLRYLRKLGLVKYRKEGKLVYYSLEDSHVEDMIKLAQTHQQEMQDREAERSVVEA